MENKLRQGTSIAFTCTLAESGPSNYTEVYNQLDPRFFARASHSTSNTALVYLLQTKVIKPSIQEIVDLPNYCSRINQRGSISFMQFLSMNNRDWTSSISYSWLERKHSGLGIPSQNGSHGKKEESRLRALNRQAVRLFTIMFDTHDCAYRGWQQYHWNNYGIYLSHSVKRKKYALFGNIQLLQNKKSPAKQTCFETIFRLSAYVAKSCWRRNRVVFLRTLLHTCLPLIIITLQLSCQYTVSPISRAGPDSIQVCC